MPPKGDDDFVPKKKEGECVKVVVRVRPLSKKEIQDGHDEATQADEDSGAHRGVLKPSRRRRDSSPSPDEVGGPIFDFEPFRTASRRVGEAAVASTPSDARGLDAVVMITRAGRLPRSSDRPFI